MLLFVSYLSLPRISFYAPLPALLLRNIFKSMSLAFSPTATSLHYVPFLPPPRTCSLSFYSASASNRLASLKHLNKQVDARFRSLCLCCLLSCCFLCSGFPNWCDSLVLTLGTPAGSQVGGPLVNPIDERLFLSELIRLNWRAIGLFCPSSILVSIIYSTKSHYLRAPFS
jgi:hypothetical protein